MKKINSVVASSILLSVALIWLLPHNLAYTHTVLDPELRQTFMQIGFASIAIVIVGLIVIWTSYSRRDRWSWVIVFIIVWVFVFPVYMLPLLLDTHGLSTVNWSQWMKDIIENRGIARAAAKGPLDFLIMLFALLLPVRPFFAGPLFGKPTS